MERRIESTSAETIAAGSVTPASVTPGITPASAPRSHTAVASEGRFVPGTLLGGRYRIIGLLGQGGMGEVYRATDLMLGQSVALKLLPETAAANGPLLERFYGEVRVARQVSHPNVCRVFDIGEAEGLPFISMEYVAGEDLASLLHRIGRLPADRAVIAARQICAGLAAAHSKGVIHRDLKPQNIMMDKHGQIMIMDFGLAALADQVSGPEARHGTPAYMSPEQLKGADVTAKSDIYALGLVLYELFTGKRPFDADSVQQLISRQENAQLTSMSSIAAEIDPAVDRVIRRCLDPEPARRPGSALAVSAALPGGDPLAVALAAGETPSPEMVAAAGKTGGLARKYSIPCLAVVLACVMVSPLLKQQTIAFYRTPNSFPPEVLQQKARDISASLGYGDKPADSAFWMEQRLELLQYVDQLHQAQKWNEWFSTEAPVRAMYRESPAPLIAQPAGQVDATNPAPLVPGMVEVSMDAAGRLRRFDAVPLPGTVAPVAAEAVFHAAQLDMGRFTAAQPVGMPRGPSDEFHAWQGPHPSLPNTPLTVEVAWWKGRITYARVISPWEPDGAGRPAAPAQVARFRDAINIAMGVAGFGFAWFLARRNWRLGRGDRRGALTLALFVAALQLVIWFGAMHPVPRSELFALAMGGLAEALLTAFFVWILYLALEPALRARWPHSIVTWNRLLAGQWRDRQVAAHVLMGAALSAGLVLTTSVVDYWQADLSTMPGLSMLNGARAWVGGFAARAAAGVQVGLVVFFAIFGLRTLLRRDWIAALISALAFAAVQPDLSNSPNVPLAYAVYVLVFGVLTFSLVRFGLVVAISTVFFLNSLNAISLGMDWTAWYTAPGLATAAVVVLIAVAAFQRSLNESAA